MTLRRRFSPVLPFGWPGNPGLRYGFRPMALRRRFSTVLPFSVVWQSWLFIAPVPQGNLSVSLIKRASTRSEGGKDQMGLFNPPRTGVRDRFLNTGYFVMCNLDFRPMTLRRRFSPVLLFTAGGTVFRFFTGTAPL